MGDRVRQWNWKRLAVGALAFLAFAGVLPLSA
jgi:hypothetical protein